MISPVTPSDFPELLKIQLDCISKLTKTYSAYDIQEWRSYLESEGADRFAKFNNLAFIKDNAIQGFISWSLGYGKAVIECLYVQPIYQSKGLGDQLLRSAESRLQGKLIEVRSTLNAVPFYEKHGYAFVEQSKSRAGFDIVVLSKNR